MNVGELNTNNNSEIKNESLISEILLTSFYWSLAHKWLICK